MIEAATRRYPDIRFRRADIRNLDYQAGGLDAVWAGYSLFHMVQKDFESTLEKIRSALVVGGIRPDTIRGTGPGPIPRAASAQQEAVGLSLFDSGADGDSDREGFQSDCSQEAKTCLRTRIPLQQVVNDFACACPPPTINMLRTKAFATYPKPLLQSCRTVSKPLTVQG